MRQLHEATRYDYNMPAVCSYRSYRSYSIGTAMVYSFECRMHVSLHPYFETQPTASGSSALAPLDTLEVL